MSYYRPPQNISSNPVVPPTMSGGGMKPMIPTGVRPPSGGGGDLMRYITGNEPTYVRRKDGSWGPAPTGGIGIPTGDSGGSRPYPVGGQPIGMPSDPSRNNVANMPPRGVLEYPGGGGPTATGSWEDPTYDMVPPGGMPQWPGGGGQMPPFQNVNSGGYYGDYNDPFNAYLSMIPVMQNQMMKDVGGAMAGAGFGGNRYGTAAMNQAGQIGAESAMKMNQMLNQTMFDQSNRDIDRALTSTKMFGDWSLQEDQGQRDWLRDLMDWGQYEQGRQDKYGMLGYEDFERNKLGYLPYLLQAAAGTGAGSSPQPYQVMTDPGQSGYGDELMDFIKNLFG